MGWRKFSLPQSVMPRFRFAPMQQVLCWVLTFLDLQAYVALCCSKEWKEQWKGVQFSRLYVLLCEQFTYPDDPWSAETLKWWNELVILLTPSFSRADKSPGKSLVASPQWTKAPQKQHGTHRVHLCVLAWILSASRGSKQRPQPPEDGRQSSRFPTDL